MESLFFNIIDNKRYKVSTLSKGILRVDISNGIFFLESVDNQKESFGIKNLDRFVLVIVIKSGKIIIKDHIEQKKFIFNNAQIVILSSSKQNLEFVFDGEIFMLFIADFFLKRYLSMQTNDPLDYLYQKIQGEISLELIESIPYDALSAYLLDQLVAVEGYERLKSIKAEHLISEFIIHIFELIDLFDDVDEDELELAKRAKKILLNKFINPPTIKELAHLCATNESKLKKVYKRVYHTTIYKDIQKLRLQEANRLLRDQQLTIGEIAKRVGYNHQGYFSKLFFSEFGIYPKDLLK
jgi:AraC-like DNA-binding protein